MLPLNSFTVERCPPQQLTFTHWGQHCMNAQQVCVYGAVGGWQEGHLC